MYSNVPERLGPGLLEGVAALLHCSRCGIFWSVSVAMKG